MKTIRPVLIAILSISLATFSGCSITKGTGSHNGSKGDYVYSIIKGTEVSQVSVTGDMYSFEDNQALPGGVLSVKGKVLGRVKGDGRFVFTPKPGTYRFEGRFIGYRSCVTKKFKLERGDILQLHFRLKYDNRPLIDDTI